MRQIQTIMRWFDEDGKEINVRFPTHQMPDSLLRQDGAVAMTVEYRLSREVEMDPTPSPQEKAA